MLCDVAVLYRREGLRVSLGFFNDVLIPDYALQQPSLFHEEEGLWVWKYEGSDMFMDIGELFKWLWDGSSSTTAAAAAAAASPLPALCIHAWRVSAASILGRLQTRAT
jgi:hypothetical protein